ncbi:MAG: RNA methyltransferase [Desulfuromonadales bacterium]|jgi:putative N6-adenine-specific DNA methylase|nr:RNA methyltransferase [Desulfuromonadales bacterium]
MSLTKYFATTAKGLEEVLAGELRLLGLDVLETATGGVSFQGSQPDGYRACLWLRTANRILQPIGSFACRSPEMLYSEVYALRWSDYLTADMTIAVDAKVRNSQLSHSRFVALKTKDGIVDKLRNQFGQRPNVDPGSPDLRINVHLANDRCTISLDLSGDGLHRRGYRQDLTVAPLRETLAAGLIGLTDWDSEAPFVDPMCGSGTLPLEAAQKATRRAPGLLGRSYGFERWPNLDQESWKEIKAEAREAATARPATVILGADRDNRALQTARSNASRTNLGDAITWQRCDFANLQPPDTAGTLLVNPPYGGRLGDSQALLPLYRSIGDTLKQRWTGWTAWVFTGNLELAKKIGLKASRRIVLYNGPIECRLLKYELY